MYEQSEHPTQRGALRNPAKSLPTRVGKKGYDSRTADVPNPSPEFGMKRYVCQAGAQHRAIKTATDPPYEADPGLKETAPLEARAAGQVPVSPASPGNEERCAEVASSRSGTLGLSARVLAVPRALSEYRSSSGLYALLVRAL